MYQDAETPQLPQFVGVTNPDKSPYVATRAWRDLYESIKNAKKFIYITGWSVYTEIQLLRGKPLINKEHWSQLSIFTWGEGAFWPLPKP